MSLSVTNELLCWNVRGIGGEGRVGTISRIAREIKVRFVILNETKYSELSERRFIWICGMIIWNGK